MRLSRLAEKLNYKRSFCVAHTAQDGGEDGAGRCKGHTEGVVAEIGGCIWLYRCLCTQPDGDEVCQKLKDQKCGAAAYCSGQDALPDDPARPLVVPRADGVGDLDGDPRPRRPGCR